MLTCIILTQCELFVIRSQVPEPTSVRISARSRAGFNLSLGGKAAVRRRNDPILQTSATIKQSYILRKPISIKTPFLVAAHFTLYCETVTKRHSNTG